MIVTVARREITPRFGRPDILDVFVDVAFTLPNGMVEHERLRQQMPRGASNDDAEVRADAMIATAAKRFGSYMNLEQRKHNIAVERGHVVEAEMSTLQARFEAGEDVSGEPGFNPDWCD